MGYYKAYNTSTSSERYSRDAPVRLQTIDKSKGKNRCYCITEDFENRANKIANEYETIEVIKQKWYPPHVHQRVKLIDMIPCSSQTVMGRRSRLKLGEARARQIGDLGEAPGVFFYPG